MSGSPRLTTKGFSLIGHLVSLSRIEASVLFELADDLTADLNGGEVSALELILQARRSGFHVLMGSDEVFAFLLEIEGLSLSARKILGGQDDDRFKRRSCLGLSHSESGSRTTLAPKKSAWVITPS